MNTLLSHEQLNQQGLVLSNPVQVTFAQEEIVLTQKEFQLLALLIRHQGKIVTQKQIMTELWGISHEEDTHYLRILVKKLRSKIGDSAVTPKYIFTIAGVGLRFQGQS